jgi:hypothetical protein
MSRLTIRLLGWMQRRGREMCIQEKSCHLLILIRKRNGEADTTERWHRLLTSIPQGHPSIDHPHRKANHRPCDTRIHKEVVSRRAKYPMRSSHSHRLTMQQIRVLCNQPAISREPNLYEPAKEDNDPSRKYPRHRIDCNGKLVVAEFMKLEHT